MTPGYRFTVRFQLDPPTVHLDPAAFDTTMIRPATPPTEEGWLFFRDYLWRGEISDPGQFERHATDLLDVPVTAIEYNAFVTSPAEWDELQSAIADNLELFRDDSVPAVVSKYFGSTVEIQEPDEDGLA